MYKNIHTEIKKYKLDDPSFYHVHKEGLTENDFGLDNSKELMDAIDIVRLRDGKLVEHWGVLDMHSLMQQIVN